MKPDPESPQFSNQTYSEDVFLINYAWFISLFRIQADTRKIALMI